MDLKLVFRVTMLSIAFFLSSSVLYSCGNNNTDEPNQDSKPENYEQFKSNYDALINTSWRLESSYMYYTVGGHDKVQDNMKSDYSQKFLPLIVTFSGKMTNKNFELYYSSIPGYGHWFFLENGDLQLAPSFHFGNPGHLTATDYAHLTNLLGAVTKIEVLTPTKLVLCNYIDGGLSNKYTFSREYGNNPNNPGDGSSSTEVEKPEIGLEDFSCTTSSITLKYRIYNQDVAKVSSAKGYYGTSSPNKSISGTIAGSLITIRINSLQRGTNYYVKCSATGKGGTATSETTKLCTLY